MGKDKLVFNVTKINNMKTTVDDTAKDLKETKRKTVKLILQLRQDWMTDAGKKMLEEINTSWATDVDKYVETLGVISQLLDEASTHYTNVQTKVNELKL